MAAAPFADLFSGQSSAKPAPFADLFGPSPSVRAGGYDVLDGDTVDVLDGEGKPTERVRLYGVDTSELGRQSAGLARKRVAEALSSGQYTLQRKGTDAHGRTLGVLVDKDGNELNRELVRGGYARSDKSDGASPYAGEAEEANRAFLEGRLAPDLQAALDDPEPYQPPRPEVREQHGDFYAGLRQGRNQLDQAAGGLMLMTGQMFDRPDMEQAGREMVIRNAQEAQEVAPRVQSYKDIHGVGDAVDFVQGAIGQGAASMAPGLLGGGVGAVGARAVVRKVVKDVAEETLKSVGKRVAVGGVAASSIGQETGSIAGDLDAAGIRSPGTAAAFGALAGLLDAAPQAVLINKLFPGVDTKLAKSFVMAVGKNLAEQVPMEATTEAAQSLIERAAVAYHDPSKDLSSPEAMDDYINSALAGAAMALVTGGVGGVGEYMAGSSRRAGPDPDGKAKEGGKREPVSTGDPELDREVAELERAIAGEDAANAAAAPATVPKRGPGNEAPQGGAPVPVEPPLGAAASDPVYELKRAIAAENLAKKAYYAARKAGGDVAGAHRAYMTAKDAVAKAREAYGTADWTVPRNPALLEAPEGVESPEPMPYEGAPAGVRAQPLVQPVRPINAGPKAAVAQSAERVRREVAAGEAMAAGTAGVVAAPESAATAAPMAEKFDGNAPFADLFSSLGVDAGSTEVNEDGEAVRVEGDAVGQEIDPEDPNAEEETVYSTRRREHVKRHVYIGDMLAESKTFVDRIRGEPARYGDDYQRQVLVLHNDETGQVMQVHAPTLARHGRGLGVLGTSPNAPQGVDAAEKREAPSDYGQRMTDGLAMALSDLAQSGWKPRGRLDDLVLNVRHDGGKTQVVTFGGARKGGWRPAIRTRSLSSVKDRVPQPETPTQERQQDPHIAELVEDYGFFDQLMYRVRDVTQAMDALRHTALRGQPVRKQLRGLYGKTQFAMRKNDERIAELESEDTDYARRTVQMLKRRQEVAAKKLAFYDHLSGMQSTEGALEFLTDALGDAVADLDQRARQKELDGEVVDGSKVITGAVLSPSEMPEEERDDYDPVTENLETEDKQGAKRRQAVEDGLRTADSQRRAGIEPRTPAVERTDRSVDVRIQDPAGGDLGQRIHSLVKDVRTALGLKTQFTVVDATGVKYLPSDVREALTRGDPRGRILPSEKHGRTYIYVKRAPETVVLLHELGHAVHFEYWERLSPAIQARVRKAWEADGRNASFNEWMANQFVSWSYKQDTPAHNAVEAFFKRVAGALRKLWDNFRKVFGEVDTTYDQFINAVASLHNEGNSAVSGWGLDVLRELRATEFSSATKSVFMVTPDVINPGYAPTLGVTTQLGAFASLIPSHWAKTESLSIEDAIKDANQLIAVVKGRQPTKHSSDVAWSAVTQAMRNGVAVNIYSADDQQWYSYDPVNRTWQDTPGGRAPAVNTRPVFVAPDKVGPNTTEEMQRLFRRYQMPKAKTGTADFTPPNKIAEAVGNALAKAANAAYDRGEGTTARGVAETLATAGRGFRRVADMLFATIDGRMRRVAKRHVREGKIQSVEDSPFWKIAQHFRTAPGTMSERDVETFYRARNDVLARYSQRAREAFDGLSEEQLKKLHALRRLGTNPQDEKVTAASKQITEIMNELHVYQRRAGLPIKYRRNYWPVMFAEGKLVDPQQYQKFVDALVENEGFTPEAAEQFADKLKDATSEVYLQENMPETSAPPDEGHLKARKFYEKLQDKEWIEEFLESDPKAIVESYLRKAATAAEYNRRFGQRVMADPRTGAFPERWNPNEKWQEYEAEARRQGATADDIRLLRQMRDAYLGRTGADTPYAVRKLFGSVMVYQNLRLLAFSTLSSVQDPVGIAIRAGNVKYAWNALRNGMKGQYGAEGFRMARALGVITDSFNDHVLSEHVDNHYTSPWLRNLNEKFFTAIGLKHWTNLTRVMAVRVGVEAMVDYAQLAQGSGPKAELARNWLAELGLNSDDVLKWAADRGRGGDGRILYGERDLTYEAAKLGRLREGVSREQLARSQKIAKALRRFVDESILRPDAAQRPAWASHPMMMLFWHLKSFMYSFSVTILPRVWHNMNTGVSSAQMASLMAALLLFPIAATALELRELIQYGSNPSPYDAMSTPEYMMTLLNRAGVLGLSQLAFDFSNAQERGKIGFISAMAGPTADQVQSAFLMPWQKTVSRAIPGVNAIPGLRERVERALDD